MLFTDDRRLTVVLLISQRRDANTRAQSSHCASKGNPSPSLQEKNIHVQWNTISNIANIKNYLTLSIEVCIARILTTTGITSRVISQKIELMYQLASTSSCSIIPHRKQVWNQPSYRSESITWENLRLNNAPIWRAMWYSFGMGPANRFLWLSFNFE